MNKLLISAILVATVMVAGIFAFVPVDKATAVHTFIINSLTGVIQTDTAVVTTLIQNEAPSFDTIHMETIATFNSINDRLDGNT